MFYKLTPGPMLPMKRDPDARVFCPCCEQRPSFVLVADEETLLSIAQAFEAGGVACEKEVELLAQIHRMLSPGPSDGRPANDTLRDILEA